VNAGSPVSLLLFVRHPAPGEVKSRISASIGTDHATELYRRFVSDMLDTARTAGYPVTVMVTPGDRLDDVRHWLGADLRYLAQNGAGLGERMENAFRAIFSEGAPRAVLIGSDIPDLPGDVLHESMIALAGNDAVIGPARDGGYYLIGFRNERFLPEIFEGIRWSSSDVFDRTMEIFKRKNASVHVLPAWQDVDTVDDLRDLMQRSRSTTFGASRTMQYLLKNITV
jgi:uncharacterized protein